MNKERINSLDMSQFDLLYPYTSTLKKTKVDKVCMDYVSFIFPYLAYYFNNYSYNN